MAVSSDSSISTFSHVRIISLISKGSWPVINSVESMPMIRVFNYFILLFRSETAQSIQSIEVTFNFYIEDSSTYL